MKETQGVGFDYPVRWLVRASSQIDSCGGSQSWLHLEVDLEMPLTCQRCLSVVNESIQIRRSYRFVETEAQAEFEDEQSEEDLLVFNRDFDLASLIEDEVLMDMPVVPRHDVCPVAVKLMAVDADFEAVPSKPNPFSALAALKSKPGSSG
jgi:uncharacterized protein